MARKRKQSWLKRLSGISIISLVVNPVTLMVLVSFVAILLWNKYHDQLDLKVNQAISHETLHLNDPPPWIRTDISRVAIQESRLSEIELGRSDAIERVAASLAVQPWIKSVDNVTKTASGIFVELQYRQPRAIVEIGDDQLVPVDDEGVVLDGRDFNAADLLDYWRISLPRPRTNGLATGTQWDDLRVNDCVLIANAWSNQRESAGLFRIVNRSQPTRDRLRLNHYELWTQRGAIVIWGNPPGHEDQDEASPEAKILAIQNYVNDNGPLDAVSTGMLDVRTGVVVPAASKLALEDADFIKLKF